MLLLGVLAGPARADVNSITVNPSSPTNAAGGRTTYVITFKTSSTGGLSQSANDRITITFPAGTDPTTQVNSQVYDTTVAPNTQIGNCSTSSTVATCGLFTGKTIGGGHAVKVVINGVTNPGQGSQTLKVRTTAGPDSMDVTSPPYTIAAAHPVTNVAVDPTNPTNAAGGRTSYVITFTASSTGGMSAAANSRITVAFPSGTDPTTQVNSQVYDTTVSATTQIGNCSASGTVVTCGLFTNQTIAAGHNVKVVVNGVTNPSAGSKTVDVSTTSDPSAVPSPKYAIAAANPVTNVSVNPSNPTRAAGGRTRYVIAFTASSTGGMSAAANSRITVAFPSGTDPTIQVNSQVYDTTVSATTQIGNCSASGTVVTCGLFTNQAIAAGHNVRVVVNGVKNPPAGSPTLDVSTTSDPSAVTSPSYSIVAAHPVTNVSVNPTDPTNAAGGRTTYVVRFKASSTGGMSAAANSKIIATHPAGTNPTAFTTSQVYDTTVDPNTSIGNCGTNGTTVTCGLFTNQSIAAGHNVKVVVNAVTNPAAGARTVDVSTTSDPPVVTSPSYNIVAAHQITQPIVTPSPRTPGADPASYTITFGVSSTGRLNAAASSKITINFAADTDIAGLSTSQVFDTTAAPNTSIGNCNDSGQVATCGLFTGQAIPAGHAVKVVLNGIQNPPGGNKTLDVSTTSDPTARTSQQYAIANQPAVSSISPTSGPAAGGTSVTIRGSTFTGATSVRFGSAAAESFTVNSATQITAISPAGSGTVDVTVTAPGGTSATNAGDRFTYTPPAQAVETTPTTQTTQAPSENPPPLTTAPTSTPGAPNVTGTREATLSAIVNPRGLPTTVRFEYGLDPELTGAPLVYDQRTPDQAVGADFTDHAVNANLSNLLTNATYHVRVVATNSAGTVTGADQVFTTKADAAPKPAVLGEKVVGAVVEGIVLIKLPGQKAAGRQAGVGGDVVKGAGFVPLTQARNLPVGTEVDARRGTIDIASATTKVGKTQSGDFGGGLFKISQSRAKRNKGLTEMRLLNSAFKGAPTFTQCAASGKTRAKKPPKSKVVQLLKANVKGRFRTRGKYAAATVRGTQWQMTDRCDGTLTVVKRGSVVVTDFRRKKDVVVRAGKSYLAKAP